MFNKRSFLAVTAFLTLIMYACSNDEAFESEFDKSLDTWKSTKKTEGNSYSYTVSFGSVFGFGSNTTLTVIDGKVTSRVYEAYQLNGSEKEIIESWSENENELNSHVEGADTITLDQIYSSCKATILSVNEDENEITFLAENNGLLSVCSYFPKNCQDDCSTGFNISEIRWID